MIRSKQITRIQNHEDLADYVAYLHKEFISNPNQWENQTLDRYLAAMEGWIRDSKGYYENQNRSMPSPEALQAIAEALTASSMYE